MMIKVCYESLKKIIFLMLALPFTVFAIGWLRWYWAIGAVVTMCVSVGICFKKSAQKEDVIIDIKASTFVILLLICFVWVFLSGIGGYWAQSKDFTYRNAIFRDLVLRDWPVIFPKTGHALVYYFGFWLVPACFGKIALLFGCNDVISFRVADTVLGIWTVILVFLVFLLIICSLKVMNRRKQIFVIILFIFFSGVDFIGCIGYDLEVLEYHFEWWAPGYQYSSITTCLFWVFNQAIPAWICILCLINEKTVRNYVFIGMMCLFYAPLPFVGWFVYCLFFAVKNVIPMVKKKKGKEIINSIFSISNLMNTFLVFPIIGSFLLSNSVIHGDGALQTTSASVEVIEETAQHLDITTNPVTVYFSFIALEFLLLMMMFSWKYIKKAVYYVTLSSLLIIPLLKIGNGHDFVMRVSIPGILFVYLLTAKFLIEEREVLKLKDSLKRFTYILVIILLVLGCATPMMEFYRGIKQTIELGPRNEEFDNIYTLGCDGPYDEPDKMLTYGNFVAVDIENQIFFKVFCK